MLVATKQDIFSQDGDISLQYFLDQASEKLSISAGRPYTHTMQVVTMFELKKKRTIPAMFVATGPGILIQNMVFFMPKPYQLTSTEMSSHGNEN